jgi:hypothetical protein
VAQLVAEVVSTTGAQMTWLALPWFVLVTTFAWLVTLEPLPASRLAAGRR